MILHFTELIISLLICLLVAFNKQAEQREEEKLKSKYPNLAKGGGGSALLNKRLHKGGVSYFSCNHLLYTGAIKKVKTNEIFHRYLL